MTKRWILVVVSAALALVAALGATTAASARTVAVAPPPAPKTQLSCYDVDTGSPVGSSNGPILGISTSFSGDMLSCSYSGFSRYVIGSATLYSLPLSELLGGPTVTATPRSSIPGVGPVPFAFQQLGKPVLTAGRGGTGSFVTRVPPVTPTGVVLVSLVNLAARGQAAAAALFNFNCADIGFPAQFCAQTPSPSVTVSTTSVS